MPGQEWVIEGVADIKFEDSGHACITSIYNDGDEDDTDDGIWVQVKSWQTSGKREDHETADLDRRLVRVVVTVLEPPPASKPGAEPPVETDPT